MRGLFASLPSSRPISAVLATVRSLLWCATAVLIYAGCEITQGPSVDAQSAEAWHLSFHLSGGFAGFDRELELASTGELTARDRRRSTQVTARAPASELADLASLVREVKPRDSGRPTACRDCLQYDVEIRRGQDTVVLRLDDSNLAGSGAERLVKILTTLLDSALAGR